MSAMQPPFFRIPAQTVGGDVRAARAWAVIALQRALQRSKNKTCVLTRSRAFRTL